MWNEFLEWNIYSIIGKTNITVENILKYIDEML